ISTIFMFISVQGRTIRSLADGRKSMKISRRWQPTRSGHVLATRTNSKTHAIWALRHSALPDFATLFDRGRRSGANRRRGLDRACRSEGFARLARPPGFAFLE